jgi:hypothetical protein
MNKVKYPADIDVLKVTWLNKKLTQLLESFNLAKASQFQVPVCIYSIQDSLPAPV